MSEFYEGPHPGPEYKPTGIEQCDVRCIKCQKFICRLLVKDCPGGINAIAEFLIKNKAFHWCNECYYKLGFKMGPLDMVNRK